MNNHRDMSLNTGMEHRLSTWVWVVLGGGGLVLTVLVAVGILALHVDYRAVRSTHHGLQRTVETGTAWLNPFDGETFLIHQISSFTHEPTRIETDFPDVFRVQIETTIRDLQTKNWTGSPYQLTSEGCGNIIIRMYEENESFREKITVAVADGRLHPFDLLPLTQYCGGPPPDIEGVRSPPGKGLVTSLLYDSLPRPALPAAQSSPSSPIR